MDENNQGSRRSRRGNPAGRSVLSDGRSARRHGARRSGGAGVMWLAIGAVVLVVALAGTAFALLRPSSASKPATQVAAGSTSVTTTITTTAASKTSTSAASKPTGTAQPSGSTAATDGPEWRSADPAWMDKYKGKLVLGFKPEPGYKAVALTFDDGPNGDTQLIIDTLKKYDGQATFFQSGRKMAMGWAKKQPSVIWDAGFELGNHTQHHTLPDGISSMWRRTYAIDLAEIKGPDVYAMRGTGRNTIWLRPMGGMIDATGIKAAVDTNHLVINWTVDSNDSHGGPRTPDYIYKTVTSGIKSGDVVLLHVTHPESMQALPRIAEELDRQGFKMVTVTELAQHSTAPITQRIPK
jgi:peptidoglycan-N-acetylglucosamine deacetylase